MRIRHALPLLLLASSAPALADPGDETGDTSGSAGGAPD